VVEQIYTQYISPRRTGTSKDDIQHRTSDSFPWPTQCQRKKVGINCVASTRSTTHFAQRRVEHHSSSDLFCLLESDVTAMDAAGSAQKHDDIQFTNRDR
jgi:hypothetical protein